MPASYYSNPIPQIIDGLLRGHELGLKMQQAARAQQEFMTNQALHNQEMSMNDIKYKMMMQDTGARPVGPGGTVQDYPSIQAPSMPISPGSSGATGGTSQGDIYNLPTRPGPTMPGQQIDYQAPASTIQNRMLTPSMPISPGNQGPPPDVSNLPQQAGPTMPGQTFSYLRKADKSRLVERPDRFGVKSAFELPTAEEQQQRDIARKSAEYQAQEAEKVQAQIKGLPLIRAAQDRLEQEEEQRTLKLEGGGIPSPAEFAAIGIRPGTLLTQKKALAALETYQGLNKPLIVPDTSRGITLGTPNLLIPGARPAQPPATAPGLPPAPSQQDQTTTTINVPGQTAQAGATAAPGTPSGPPGMKVLIPANPKFDAKELFVKSMAKSLYNTTPENLTGPQMEEIQRREEATKFNPEIKRHNLSMEENARVNTGIRAGQLRQTQLVNGIEYGPDTQDYWVKTLQENPDAVGEIPAKLKGAVNLKFRAATGLPMPTALPTTAKSQEIAARTSLDNLAAIQEILKDPEIQKQVGPIMGRLQNVEQRAGTAVNLSPQAENKAQELRTLMRYFTLSEGKAIMGGRIVSKVQEQLNASSPRVDMDASMLQGAIKGAGDYANTILDNTDKQRFGGKMRSREMRGAGPQQGGKVADATIIKQYLDAAGGDKNKARQALGAAGYTIPGAQ